MTAFDDFGPWNTTTQAAPKLGLHPKTIQTMCAAGLIPHRKVGRRYMISDQQIADFNRSHTRSPRRATQK